MTRFWGDEGWRNVAYPSQSGLFGPLQEKTDNQAIVDAFAKRLRDVGGFKHAAEPLPMRNSTNAVVYYLLFASQNATAHKIISDIFKKYRSA